MNNAIGKQGAALLWEAVGNDRKSMELLLEHGANLDARIGPDGEGKEPIAGIGIGSQCKCQ
jgi:hypothetical protein